MKRTLSRGSFACWQNATPQMTRCWVLPPLEASGAQDSGMQVTNCCKDTQRLNICSSLCIQVRLAFVVSSLLHWHVRAHEMCTSCAPWEHNVTVNMYPPRGHISSKPSSATGFVPNTFPKYPNTVAWVSFIFLICSKLDDKVNHILYVLCMTYYFLIM